MDEPVSTLLPSRFTRLRRLATRWVSVGCVVYLGLIGYVAWNEPAQIFPGAYRARPDKEPRLPEWVRTTTFTAADGLTLSAIEDAAPPADARWVLYFHGQWGRVRSDVPKMNALRDAGLNFFAPDYRGYAGNPGRPSEDAFCADALAAFEHLKARGIPAERIVIYGHSLGSGVAIDLASRVPAAGLIVDGAYRSLPQRGAEVYPWLPIRWIARLRLDSESKIARVAMPKLFCHGISDQAIPVKHARALFALATEPKLMRELEGNHDDFAWADSAAYRATIAEFIGTHVASPGAR